MESTPIAIDVKNLTKRYAKDSPTQDALLNVSFQVPMGHICCLLGPNGSGKTTLLKVLAGLLTPTSGSVHLMGLDPLKEPAKVKSKKQERAHGARRK